MHIYSRLSISKIAKSVYMYSEMNVERIINYLILEELSQLEDGVNPNTLMKIAFIKAIRKFEKMSKKEKYEFFKKIDNGADGGT